MCECATERDIWSSLGHKDHLHGLKQGGCACVCVRVCACATDLFSACSCSRTRDMHCSISLAVCAPPQVSIDTLRELNPGEIGDLLNHPRMGPILKNFVDSFPSLVIDVSVKVMLPLLCARKTVRACVRACMRVLICVVVSCLVIDVSDYGIWSLLRANRMRVNVCNADMQGHTNGYAYTPTHTAGHSDGAACAAQHRGRLQVGGQVPWGCRTVVDIHRGCRE